MNTPTIRSTVLALALSGLLAPAAFAQAEPTPAPAPTASAPTPSFSWSSPAIEKFVQAMSGSWQSTGAIGTRGSGESVDVMLSIAPIAVTGLSDTIYMEAAPVSSPNDPFRQTIAQVRAGENGAIRLRTFEIGAAAYRGMVEGAWALDRPVPVITVENLVPTMDITLAPNRSNGYSGKTDHAYPTLLGGAETMTSTIELSNDTLTIADRGLSPKGDVVWGPAKNEAGYAFKKVEAPVSRTEHESGLIVIDIGSNDAPKLEQGDQFFANYAGWTSENGLFDSSFYPGRQPIRAMLPQPGQPGGLIQGWLQGLDGASPDIRRILVIPADLGYGAQGRPQAGIEPNATLYFAVEVTQIQKPSGQQIREGMPTPQRPAEEGEQGE